MGEEVTLPPVATVDPTAARFPEVSAKAGHYESFYLKLCHPSEPLGAWIRYTVHKRPGAAVTGSLWFTLFEPSGPRAAKLTVPGPESGGADWLRVGEARIGSDGATGSIPSRGSTAADAAWELALEGAEEPLFHLPASWLYRAPLPRTKLLSPAPAARFSGRIEVDGRSIEVDGWRGMAGHNWGAQHAERWIWLHGLTRGRRLARRGDRARQGGPADHAVGRERSAQHRRRPARAPSRAGYGVAEPLHVHAVRARGGGARHGGGAARALRRLGLRRSRTGRTITP